LGPGLGRDAVVSRGGAVQRAAIAPVKRAAGPELWFERVPEATGGRFPSKGGPVIGPAGMGAVTAVHPHLPAAGAGGRLLQEPDPHVGGALVGGDLLLADQVIVGRGGPFRL